jgi:hypothetical protein
MAAAEVMSFECQYQFLLADYVILSQKFKEISY